MESPSAGNTDPHFQEKGDGFPESAKEFLAEPLIESVPESLPEPLPDLLESLPEPPDEPDDDAEDEEEEEEAQMDQVMIPPGEEEVDKDPEELEGEDAKEELQQAEEEHGIGAEDILEQRNEELVEEEVEEYEYTKEEVQYMKTAFAAYQKEKPEKKKKAPSPRRKGTKEIKVTEIPVGTLGSVLRSLGLNPTQAALKSYADWLDLDADPKDEDGVVKFDELLIIVGREKKVVIDESHVLEAFRSFDVENNQLISIETLQQLLVLSGERFSPEEWIIFVHLADPKKTSLVDYENFVVRMGPNPPAPPKKKKGKKGKKKGKSK